MIAGPGALRANSLQAKLSKLTSDQQDAVNKAKKYAMEQSIKSILAKQNLAQQQQQQKSLQRHQAIVLMCRVYVGSISFELKEETIRNAFAVFGPIKTINMSFDPLTQKHKGFAFVEYELPEAAQLALDQMNGFLMGGRNIKVGRPSNMPQAAPIIEQLNEEAKGFNRVYIANILQGITEQDLYLVFEAFGKIKSCSLIQSSVPGKHKGYSFIEYETEQAALDAIVSMNLFDLGGQQLRVGRSITPPNLDQQLISTNSTMPTASALAAAAVTAKIQAMEASTSIPNLQNKLTSSSLTGLSISTLTTNPVQPVYAKNVAGVITGVTLSNNNSSSSSSSSSNNSSSTQQQQPQTLTIQSPTVITNLPIINNSSSSNGANSLANNNNNSATAITNGLQALNEKLSLLSKVDSKLENSADELQSLQQQENMSIKGANARQMLMQKLMRKIESKVVVLQNMVTVDEIDDDLESEVTDECGKFGNVKRVIIYQEKQSDEDDADVIVKIFVEFQNGSCKFCLFKL